jgi:hypothetical protein
MNREIIANLIFPIGAALFTTAIHLCETHAHELWHSAGWFVAAAGVAGIWQFAIRRIFKR